MIFHYVDGALVCEVKVRGLTQTLPEFNELSSRFYGYRDPEDEDQWWWTDDMDPAYGGYRYFVCESLTRRAAQMIVDALGGYLVPERVPPSRQLTASKFANHTKPPFRLGRAGAIVADDDTGLFIHGTTGPENVEHYGGYLIAESVTPDNAEFVVAACNFYWNAVRAVENEERRPSATTTTDEEIW